MKKAMAAAGLILTLVLQTGTAVYAAPDGDGGAPEQLDYTAPLQYELESANAVTDSKEKETVAITIPIGDRNLLRELVRRFGWVGVF